MPSSHLRYVEPGVELAYVPLSHTVIEPPFAACSFAPLPACAAKAAPATSRAAQTSVTRPRLELFIVSPPVPSGSSLPYPAGIAVRAPSIVCVAPVMYAASSELRNTTSLPTSLGSPSRCAGTVSRMLGSSTAPRAASRSHIGVRSTPGAIAFTRTPCGAHSPAATWVIMITAAFGAQYVIRPVLGEKPRIDEMLI